MHYFKAKKQFSFDLLNALYLVRCSWTIVLHTTVLNGIKQAFELTTPEMQDDDTERPATTEGHPEDNNDQEGIDDASTYPSTQEDVATAELLRRYFKRGPSIGRFSGAVGCKCCVVGECIETWLV